MHAVNLGADIVGTTLAGYTDARPTTVGPDLELLREVVRAVHVPVIAEGRYTQRWEVDAALRIGAVAVTIGGALNDPVKQTRALWPSALPQERTAEDAPGTIGAVDIGGTWLRFGTFTEDWRLVGEVQKVPYPEKMADRLAWIREQISASGVRAVGVGTGGIVDPRTGKVWTAKEYLMPNHIGIVFDETERQRRHGAIGTDENVLGGEYRTGFGRRGRLRRGLLGKRLHDVGLAHDLAGRTRID